MLSQTAFRPISIGIVSANKPRGTAIINVVPIELVSDVKDDINNLVDVITTQGLDGDDNAFKVLIERSISIEAEWLGEAQRQTAPDVRRGELVWIYQVADEDKYYWEEKGRSLNLRRLETIVYSYSADPDNADVEMTRDNSYVYEVSTHDKHVTFSTSDKNGEAAKYTSQYNLEKGIYSLEDNHRNFFYLDSIQRDIQMQNGDGSFLRLNKRVLDGYAKDLINLKTKNVVINCDDYKVTSKTYLNTTGKYTKNADSSSISGPQTHSSPIAFPSFSSGPGAAAGGSGNTIVGTLSQSGGKMDVKNATIATLNTTTLVTASIKWSSADGPLP